MGPIVQFDQKKVPVYHGEPGKDTITVREWIRRMEGLRTTMDWTEEQTFENAQASLFGSALQIMLSQSKKTINDDYTRTWTWMKKKMLQLFGGLAGDSGRAIVDILASLKPLSNMQESMLKEASRIDQEFDKLAEILDQPNVPDGGPFTRAECQRFCEAAVARTVEQICMGFVANLMPAPLRAKVLDKGPRTMGETLKYVNECQKALWDEHRPVGNDTRRVQPVDLISTPELASVAGQLYEQMVNVVRNNMEVKKPNNPTPTGTNNGNRRGRGGRNNGGNNRNNAPVDKSQLKCSHCQGKGHGVLDCFKRIDAHEPCYNNRGEPYFPASDQEKRDNRRKVNQAQPANYAAVPEEDGTDELPAMKEETPEVTPPEVTSPADNGPDSANDEGNSPQGSVFQTWV